MERAVALIDALFALDRQAHEQNLSLFDRRELRQEHAPPLLSELHALLVEIRTAGAHLPKSAANQAID